MHVVTGNIHKFEHHGLGKSPFRLVGMFSLPSKSLLESNPGAYNMQMSSIPKEVSAGMCDYCSTPLVHHFVIQSSDDKHFVVGCDCVAKTGDTGLVNAVKMKKRAVNAEKRAQAKRVKYASEMQAQRDANNGLTHGEVRAIKVKALDDSLASQVELLVDTIPDITNALRNTYGDFARTMSGHLANGHINEISPRVSSILVEIASKHFGGRMNSKAYQAKHDVYAPLMRNVLEQYGVAREQYQASLRAL